jgi:hypothetical protein
MFTVTVSHNALRALAITAAVADVRGYLCGACIDTTTEGRVHLVSTDGHRMLIVNAKGEGDIAPGRFIVPTEAFKNAKPVYKKDPVEIVVNPEGSEGGTYEVRGKVTVSGRLLDGRFPDWTRVLPEKMHVQNPGKPAHFNFGYVGDFGRVAELLDCKYPHVVPNGEASAFVYLGADAFGILMPIRTDSVTPKEKAVIDWLAPVNGEERKAA